ncbi:MAG: DNA polymerase III subunit [Chloroflexota bacterium]|nr:DNA polymerase III subunit [Chloroflexota bacterium]
MSIVGPALTNGLLSNWGLWGRDDIIGKLQGAMAADRVHHAYLFSGPSGSGKASLALAFARALCCQNPPGPGDACRVCLACRKISRQVHPDVRTYCLMTQAAQAVRGSGKNTTLTIETVREISASIVLRPVEAAWRVIIIEDAESLQAIAQEALLKTLEEPPTFLVLLLLTDDSELLLPTIQSRCEAVDFRPVGRKVIASALVQAGFDTALAERVATLSLGRPGWAFQASRAPEWVEDRSATFVRAIDWIESSRYERLVTAVRLADTFSASRDDVFAEIDALLIVWRDALLLQAGLPDQLLHDVHRERLIELVGGWTMSQVRQAIQAVLECLGDLRANVRPRLATEAMVLQWPMRMGRR